MLQSSPAGVVGKGKSRRFWLSKQASLAVKARLSSIATKHKLVLMLFRQPAAPVQEQPLACRKAGGAGSGAPHTLVPSKKQPPFATLCRAVSVSLLIVTFMLVHIGDSCLFGRMSQKPLSPVPLFRRWLLYSCQYWLNCSTGQQGKAGQRGESGQQHRMHSPCM